MIGFKVKSLSRDVFIPKYLMLYFTPLLQSYFVNYSRRYKWKMNFFLLKFKQARVSEISTLDQWRLIVN